jgi:DNA-binding MarR family transcriptional regulator
MQAKGYVTRQKMPDNKKQVRVFLTHAGLQLKSLIVPQAEEINDMALAGIDPLDVQATRRTLIAMAQNLSLIATDSESPHE